MTSEKQLSKPAMEPARTAPVPTRSWQQRWIRRLLGLVVVVLALWALLWLTVPPLVRWQGQKIAGAELGRPVHIGKVRFLPWSLELTAQDLSVGGVDGGPDPLSIKRLYANASIASLWKLAPVLDDLQIDDPAIHVTRLSAGHYDIDDILARFASQPKADKPSKPVHFALYNIVLQGGSMDLDDRVVGRVQELRDLKLSLPFLSDLPAARQVKVLPQLAFTLNGSSFQSSAEALPFDPSQRTEAKFRIADFDLTPYLGYLPADLPLHLQAGVVDADLHLAFEQTPKPALRLSGTAALSKLQALDARGAPALAFDALKVNLADVNPLERNFHLASVELVRPNVTVARNAAGALNWMPAAAPSSVSKAAPVRSQGAAGEKTSGAKEAVDEQDKPALSPAGAGMQAAAADKPEAAPEKSAASAEPPLAVTVDAFTIRDGAVHWHDETAGGKQAANAYISQLELDASSITYPVTTPLALKGSAAVSQAQPVDAAQLAITSGATVAAESGESKAAAPEAKPGDAATVQFDGHATVTDGEVTVQTAGIPLALAAPYLSAYLEPHLSGSLSSDVTLQWEPSKEKATALAWSVKAKSITLDKLLLAGEGDTVVRKRKSASSNLAQLGRLQVTDLQVNPQAQSVTVGKLDIQGPEIQVQRDHSGHWMFERWLRTPEPARTSHAARPVPKSHAAKGEKSAPWSVAVKALNMAGGAIGWLDETTAQPVRAQISELHVAAQGLDLQGKKPVPLELSARVAGERDGVPGRLAWRGKVAWAPVEAVGTLDAERLPLQAFLPYADNQLNVRVEHAEGGFKGRIDYTAMRTGPRVRVDGNARIDDLRTFIRPGTVVSRESAGLAKPDERPARTGNRPQELFSTKQLQLDGVKVALEPGRAPQIAVGSTLLAGFFARVVINSNGRINLQDIAGKGDAGAETSKVKAETTAVPVAETPAQPKARDPLAPIIRMGPVRLKNGHIDFTDHFIRPNYSADLTALNGSLGAFSAGASAQPQMAKLTLTGKAEGTAALDVEGEINPLADPLELDVHAKVTDLELPPLSPYAIKYSGHGIERGKLSMDVAYKIQPDGQLTASNKLVLNQLQFGKPVEGAPASLPVELATALLANSDGVIDLDLPISGSLNDPKFSLGPVIFKAVVGLIGKAITSPFTLIAHALGGGESGKDLSQVSFAPGSAWLSAEARKQLDGVIKVLDDKPQLKLTVTGEARLADEEEGAKRQRLYAQVAAEQGAGETAAEEADPAAIASSPEYAKLLKRLYGEAKIPGKPRNFIGLQRSEPVAEMEKLLLAHMTVSEDAMRKLAIARGLAVKDYLAGKGVAASRLFLGAPESDKAADGRSAEGDSAARHQGTGGAWTPHAQLSLGMQ